MGTSLLCSLGRGDTVFKIGPYSDGSDMYLHWAYRNSHLEWVPKVFGMWAYKDFYIVQMERLERDPPMALDDGTLEFTIEKIRDRYFNIWTDTEIHNILGGPSDAGGDNMLWRGDQPVHTDPYSVHGGLRDNDAWHLDIKKYVIDKSKGEGRCDLDKPYITRKPIRDSEEATAGSVDKGRLFNLPTQKVGLVNALKPGGIVRMPRVRRKDNLYTRNIERTRVAKPASRWLAAKKWLKSRGRCVCNICAQELIEHRRHGAALLRTRDIEAFRAALAGPVGNRPDIDKELRAIDFREVPAGDPAGLLDVPNRLRPTQWMQFTGVGAKVP